MFDTKLTTRVSLCLCWDVHKCVLKWIYCMSDDPHIMKLLLTEALIYIPL